MNKRQKKKSERALITLKGYSFEHVVLYINRKHWNKGKGSKIMFGAIKGDYLTNSYLRKINHSYVVHVENCKSIHIVDVRKSWDNKNHVVVV